MRIKEGIGLFSKIDYKVLIEQKQMIRQEMGEMFNGGDYDDRGLDDSKEQEVDRASRQKIAVGKSKGAVKMVEI